MEDRVASIPATRTLFSFEAVAQEGGKVDILGIDVDRLELVGLHYRFNPGD
jgi:hypothetical protein